MILSKRLLTSGAAAFGAFVFLVLWAGPPAAADEPIHLPSDIQGPPGTPIQVHGDNVEYFHEEEKVVGTGNVVVEYEGTKLTADKVTVYTQTKVAVAEGHVVLTQKGSIFRGERAEYDFNKKIGNVSQMSAEIAPSYYGKAQRIEKVSDNHYRAVNSYVTTCCGDSPFYKIQAQSIDIYPEKKVVAKNALLLVNGIPVFYVPYFVQPLYEFERSPIELVPGRNKEWGAFLLSKWRYHLVNTPSIESKGNVLVDFRARRGWGGGVENFYRSDRVGRGAFRAYGLEDKEPPLAEDDQRYRTQWRHQAKLGADTTMTVEMNKLSDSTILKDFFFREEYERDVSPDNYLSIVTAKPEYTLSVLDRERMNDFFTVTERSPEIRFDTQNQRFAETPYYLRAEYQFSNLKKEFPGSPDQLDLTRFDTNHTLSYAGRVGAVSVTPRLGTRQTFYSRAARDDRNLVRGTFEPGVDVSTHFFKTYDTTVTAFGLDYNQIRHIFAPTASYTWRPNPTVSRTLLEPFDSVDILDKQNVIRWNFDNRLQTKHHQGDQMVMREIARIVPFFDTDLHTGRLDNVGIDAELRLYSWFGIETDATYNTRDDDLETANADVFVEKAAYRVAVGQRYLKEESSQSTSQIWWKIRPDLEMKFYQRYEIQKVNLEELEILLSKAFDCVIVDFTYNHRDSDTFFIVFRLKAFPKTSFGLSQSYRRPKSPAPARLG